MKILTMIILLALVGCKSTANYNNKAVEYEEHTFSKQVDIYIGDKIIKKFKYSTKEKIKERLNTGTYLAEGQYSCSYAGYCFRYGKYKFSSFCNGRRFEKRKYATSKVSPKIKYSRGRKTLLLDLPEYDDKDFIRLETGTCN